jgi:hypothetical protein
MIHYITYCKECNMIIGQCRCPSKDKEIRWDICDYCKPKNNNNKIMITVCKDCPCLTMDENHYCNLHYDIKIGWFKINDNININEPLYYSINCNLKSISFKDNDTNFIPLVKKLIK